ncbi:hypothetical protein GZ77_13645 [Endozoicomonas montiporae]|uniref:Uncharacterized protein n=2 Tax=Endozoicomonas montiporae TaxID=1027273 RepID=A0A081N4P9_9GAMM|nr:hypothetical protein [Endozoicomonas montiporae]AMO57699.1 hypothetical protein EZMO1_3746 [Endozoicomonas montiporae CL-33]KEQ13422.1 hypothetical protein GZ77_13645 [Endozoicomonas montiporae]
MILRAFILCFTATNLLSNSIYADNLDNYCTTVAHPAQKVSQYCSGIIIPASKTRNFQGERLLCSNASDRKIRHPVDFDEEAWRDKLATDRQGAFEMLRTLPDPVWQGTLKYKSHLNWSWQDCQKVTDAEKCGTEQHCKTVTNRLGEREKKCKDKSKTCYVDIDIHESVFCSHEKTDYEIRYLKSSESEWNPEHDHFTDRLANGYDLLPGEEETVVVDNGADLLGSRRLAPKVYFKNQRNQYIITMLDTPPFTKDNLYCQQRSQYTIGFSLMAKARIRSRSGNDFSIPAAHDGAPLEALIWQSARDQTGKRKDKGYPAVLQVQDYSAKAMHEFADDTDNTFKHIVLRIQLYEKTPFGILPWATSTQYTQEAKAVTATLNALSDEQAIRRSALWQINLANQLLHPDKNLYRVFVPWFVYYPARLVFSSEALSYEYQLKPATNYKLSVTTYQKGLSIYHQSCEDEPNAWDCQFYAGWGWFSPNRYEHNYYSDNSLDITFTTESDVNLRTWWPVIWATIGWLDELAIATSVWVLITRNNLP